MEIKTCLLIFLLLACCLAQKLVFYPTANDRKFAQVKVSPIGFNPRSGQLDGRLVIAEPFDGCSPINNLENDQEDVFVFVNDLNCLQSIKAKNVLKSGALAGIIRQNSSATWHDRQISIVHIPILELQGEKFDHIISEIKQSKDNEVVASILFGEQAPMTDITIELWMSPTQTDIYSFILNMEKFLNNEKNEVTFSPRYAMHSQKDRKSFIGCYSNGMYCPGQIDYDGKLQGQNIISQSLRQIIIREMSIQKWWKYIKHYYVQCLRNTDSDVFMDSRQLSVCTRNSMMLAEIDYNYVEKEMNQSFMGSRKQVDDNIWLREERQDYIRQKVTQYPVLLINKKEFNEFDLIETRMTICKMEHNRSDECSQILDGKLHSSEWFIILGVVLVIIVFILIAYKYIMYRRMQKQMKGQVTSTLQQYYRYMETLEGDAQPQPKLYFSKPDLVNNIGNEHKKETQEQQSAPEIEIEMTNTYKNSENSTNPKQKHHKLVQEESH